MSAHTPGPWVSALDHNSRPIVWGPGTWQIADCWHTPDGNGWGNARLIAAAPDLLDSNLKFVEAVDALYNITPAWIDDRIYDELPSSGLALAYFAARAAIAKAIGGEA